MKIHKRLVLILAAFCAAQVDAQDLLNADFSTTFPSYSYGYAYAGQGTPDCTTNVDNGSETSVIFDDAIAEPNLMATADYSQWVVDPAACWTYAGVGLGAGHVLGSDDGNGNVTYERRFTSNDLSQYSISLDAWVEGFDPIDPLGISGQLAVQFQGPGDRSRQRQPENFDAAGLR